MVDEPNQDTRRVSLVEQKNINGLMIPRSRFVYILGEGNNYSMSAKAVSNTGDDIEPTSVNNVLETV